MSAKKKWLFKEDEPFTSSKKKAKTPAVSPKKVQAPLTQTTQAETMGDKTMIIGSTLITEKSFEEDAHPSHIVLVFGQSSLIGTYWPLNKTEILIGRSWRSDICIRSPSISKRHIMVHKEENGEFTVKDLNSTNGTSLNDKHLQPQKEYLLENNNIIRIGRIGLKFLSQDNKEIASIAQSYKNSFFDVLTGAGNRSLLENKAPDLFYLSQKRKTPLSLVIFDIDFFKKINDTYGHRMGDFVLKEVGEQARKGFRAEDLFIRCGGEEFCIILSSPLENAYKAIEKVRQGLENRSFQYEGKSLKLTISAGLTQRKAQDKSWEVLYERADKALYTAKYSGRNKTHKDS